MKRIVRYGGLALLFTLLAACGGGGDNTEQINAPSAAASANVGNESENAPGSGTGDGTGSDATTGSLESTTIAETEQDGAATGTGTDQGDPNVSPLLIGVTPNQSLFTVGVMSAPANRELEIVFSNPSQQPHNWVLVEPGKEQAVADAAAAKGGDPSGIEGVIAWGETVTSADTRIKVPPLELGSYPYISTVPGDFPNMNGALDVTVGSN